MAKRSPQERRDWLAGLKREATLRRDRLLAQIGPAGSTPLHFVRVVPGKGGTRRHASSEGVTVWYEPEELYLARFIGRDGEPGEDVLVEEEDALRWAFALGWGEKDE